MNDLQEQLEDLQARRDEIFEKFKNDKDNPYWYEDWGSSVKSLDKQIDEIKQKIKDNS